jgi:hypothetical protein
MSQITSRRASRFVVPTYSRRPAAWARATAASSASSTCASISFASGSDDAAESENRTATRGRRR